MKAKELEIHLGLYKHYKGDLYQVIGLARHSETLDTLVVYQSLYGSYGLWVRPIDQFTAFVKDGDKEVPRFTYLAETFSKAPNLRKS